MFTYPYNWLAYLWFTFLVHGIASCLQGFGFNLGSGFMQPKSGSIFSFERPMDAAISLLDRFQTMTGSTSVLKGQEEQFIREQQLSSGNRLQTQSPCLQTPINCLRSRYRASDGTCNNFHNPRMGSAGQCIPRMFPSEYGDGISSPRVSVTGAPLPNPRTISLKLHSEPIEVSKEWTSMFMIWGQFVDHDITFTVSAQSETGGTIRCCNTTNTTKNDAKWCLPIQLSPNDPFYSKVNQTCIEFVRNAACPSCPWGPRLQMNVVTPVLDGSQVYGSSLNETLSLRNSDGSGTLKNDFDSKQKPLLPRSFNPSADGCSVPSTGAFCFQAGDRRANQQSLISSLQNIWLRQHNRIAAQLREVNPTWDDERIFQNARRIVIAQIQIVTYKQWLPITLGTDLLAFYKLKLLPNGFTQYDPTRDPSTTSEFATAAYRFGHALINGQLAQVKADGTKIPYRLKDDFFQTYKLRNGSLDDFVRGLASTPSNNGGPMVDIDVRDHLYQTQARQFGGDLVSINIQRGRDHGIPGYASVLRYCYGVNLYDWNQLDKYMPTSQRVKYQSIYINVRDIELFTGGISENKLPNAAVGPTFACIIGNQFQSYRFGDRYWFEHGNQDGSFTEGQLNNLREVTNFAQIICSTANVPNPIQPDVFLPVSKSNPLTPCPTYQDIDFTLWKNA